ncbi:unnamed protein product [Symbiodinium microadriaticum]|nr:unnamed protein product [Symbiodinium microadriaticum]
MFRELRPSPSEVIDLSDLCPAPKLSLVEFEDKCNLLATLGHVPTHSDLLELWDLMPLCLLSANAGERTLLECLTTPVAERDACEIIEICSDSESDDSVAFARSL